MSAQKLRDAAKVLRERAEAATPGPWEVAGPYESGFTYLHNPEAGEEVARFDAGSRPDRLYIATMHPGVALALADWLDAEAAVQDSMQPMAEFVSLAIEQVGGPAGYVRILHDDDGNPQMQADSSPAAFRLTDLILGAE